MQFFLDLWEVTKFSFTNLNDFATYKGFVLGLMYDSTDTTHKCYIALDDFETNLATVTTFVDDYRSYQSGTSIEKTTVGDYGVYVLFARRILEQAVLFFSFYQ